MLRGTSSFDLISAPYLGRTTRVGPILTTTVETVRFEPPRSVYFRLVRGPVPLVLERFELQEAGGGTMLEYTGRLGTDLWGLDAGGERGWVHGGRLLCRARWMRCRQKPSALVDHEANGDSCHPSVLDREIGYTPPGCEGSHEAVTEA